MAIKLRLVSFISLMISASLSSGGNAERSNYTASEYLKNYALSACLADGYQAKDVVSDATAGAVGYKELGGLDIDAYNDALVIVRKFLNIEYSSRSSEAKLIIMKCIDLYHSKELDQLVHKYTHRFN